MNRAEASSRMLALAAASILALALFSLSLVEVLKNGKATVVAASVDELPIKEVPTGDTFLRAVSPGGKLLAVWNYGRFGSNGLETPGEFDRRTLVWELADPARRLAVSETMSVRGLAWDASDTLWVEGEYGAISSMSAPDWQLRPQVVTGALAVRLGRPFVIARTGESLCVSALDGTTDTTEPGFRVPKSGFLTGISSSGRHVWCSTSEGIEWEDLDPRTALSTKRKIVFKSWRDGDPLPVSDISPSGERAAFLPGDGLGNQLIIMSTEGEMDVLYSSTYFWSGEFMSEHTLIVDSKGVLAVVDLPTGGCKSLLLSDVFGPLKDTFATITVIRENDLLAVQGGDGNLRVASLSGIIQKMTPSRRLKFLKAPIRD